MTAHSAHPVPARALEALPALKDSWHVRDAELGDVEDIVAALARLLSELGGSVPAPRALDHATRAVIGDPDAGCLLVADTPAGIVGVLAASWLHAIHVPGPYCVLQDLWVEPEWRSDGVGAFLLAALFDRMRARGTSRIEVGLPSERFPALAQTTAFYERNGFELLGPRMRQVIA